MHSLETDSYQFAINLFPVWSPLAHFMPFSTSDVFNTFWEKFSTFEIFFFLNYQRRIILSKQFTRKRKTALGLKALVTCIVALKTIHLELYSELQQFVIYILFIYLLKLAYWTEEFRRDSWELSLFLDIPYPLW